METMQTIPQPAAAQALAAKPRPVAANLPPWIEDDDEPVIVPARRQLRKAAPVGRREFAAVHWGVVLLTLFTAASVLFGSYRADVSHSRELLPIMITTSAG